MNAEKREKVIKGLECCAIESSVNFNNSCRECPYVDHFTCRELKQDALELVKELMEERHV